MKRKVHGGARISYNLAPYPLGMSTLPGEYVKVPHSMSGGVAWSRFILLIPSLSAGNTGTLSGRKTGGLCTETSF